MSFAGQYTYFKSLKIGGAWLLAATLSCGLPPLAIAQEGGIASLFGQKQQSKILPVHQAFKVNVSQKDGALVATFTITPEHYIYKDKLMATLPDGVSAGAWQFSGSPTSVDDPEFGQVLVFDRDVVATLPLTIKSGSLQNAPVSLKWQGCAKAGLCYPPETIQTTITLNAKADTPPAPQNPTPAIKKPETAVVAKIVNEPTNLVNPETSAVQNASSPTVVSEVASVSSVQAKTQTLADDEMVAEQDIFTTSQTEPSPFEMTTSHTEMDLASATKMTPSHSLQPNHTVNHTVNHTLANQETDPFGINKHPVVALFLLFLAGLLLSFTPCVYPMIPIVANIVARQKTTSSTKGFVLSAAYGVGVATAYGLLGALVAGFGQAIGIVGWLQNPYVLGVFAVLFLIFALAMFDVIKLQIPSSISGKLQQKSQLADGQLGSIWGSFLVGALSALVVSPCVSLPMAGALTAVAASGSAVFGFLALFMLGLGLSLPLMVVGAVQGKFMPKAGAWMNAVKEFCGFLLLAVALSLLERIFVSAVMLVIWAGWFALVAIWLWRLSRLPALALAFVSAIWSVCLVVGAAIGQTDAWRPLSGLMSSPSVVKTNTDIKITTLAQLDEILASHDKVLVDITADWCIECRIIEKELFANRPSALMQYQVVKLDITQTDEHSRAVLARYQLVGPPALLLYKNGQLSDVLLGSVQRADFERALSAL